ncbi:MAG: hypothetical protein K2K15_06075 [Anaeroplasmataceae bacterium]|nr:hypothetical protein [Anaeroplasmataceae bacterium]
MIYTLTLSPSIDLYMRFSSLNLGQMNRAEEEYAQVGGKGINVSLQLKSLGLESVPIVVVGGFTGNYIAEFLQKDFNPILIYSKNLSRINPKVQANYQETELNASTELEEDVLVLVKEKLSALKSEDVLVVSGNAPLEVYQFLLKDVSARLVLDVRGRLLLSLQEYHPWIVKPNQAELEEIDADAISACKKLLKNSSIVLYTKGALGAELWTKDKVIRVDGKNMVSKSQVGCGDAFLAAFLKHILDGCSLEDSLDFANECGSYRAKYNVFMSQKRL